MIQVTRSLKTALLFSLLIPTFFAWWMAAVWTYRITREASSASYDYILSTFVEALANRVHLKGGQVALDFPTEVISILREQHVDKRFYEVRDHTGRLLGGNATGLLPPLVPNSATVSDSVFNNIPIRLALKRAYIPASTAYCDIAIAETMDGRLLVATQVLKRLIVIKLILLIFLCLSVIWAVRRSLASLLQARNEVAALSLTNCATTRLSTTQVPPEIKPLVTAINDLLDHVNDDVNRQRRFITNAAHQLRTPLAGLKVQADLLNRDQRLKGLATLLEPLGTGIEKACNLVQKMLTLATTEPAKFTAESFSPCEITALSAETIRNLVPHALRKEIDIGLDHEEESILIMGNSWALKEMLTNLVDNAIRYTPKQGTVTVSIGHDNESALIVVEDTGCGIPEAERERIFERFYRIPQTSGDGSGLGLAIVKEIVEQHRGTIQVRSGSSGKGTRFEVRFPLINVKHDVVREEGSSSASASASAV